MLSRASVAFLLLSVGASALSVKNVESEGAAVDASAKSLASVESDLNLYEGQRIVTLKPGSQQDAPVFYVTVMNKLAGKHQTRLWLSSLRKVGNWKGDVVMVTDRPHCLWKNLNAGGLLGDDGKKISEDADGKLHVYSGGEGYGKIYMLLRKPTNNVAEMKRMKAAAWANLREAQIDHQVSFIIYTDQDIVFGQDLFEWSKELLVIEKNPPLLALFEDQGVSKGQLHTGIIVMFRGEAAEACLNAWGKKILKQSAGTYHGFAKESVDAEEMLLGPDQKSLMKTKSCTTGDGIVKMNQAHLNMPTKKSLEKGTRATFIHFTNTNRWRAIKPTTMQKYFDEVLKLPKNLNFFGFETCEKK